MGRKKVSKKNFQSDAAFLKFAVSHTMAPQLSSICKPWMVNDKKETKRLIKGCIKGREKDYEKLYHKYYGFLFSVCLRYARDREEAKDILHSGYMRVFKNLEKYTFSGSFEGWIKRIIVNEAINYYKRVNKENRTQYYENHLLVETDDRESDSDVFSQMAYEELLAIIQQLSPAYRNVFNMFAIEGYSHREIAETLGITESTSKANLVRARAILKKKVVAKEFSEQKKIADYAG